MIITNKGLILLLIAVSYTVAASANPREFLSSYFRVIYGKEWELSEDCLDGEFIRDLNELYHSVLRVRIMEIVKNIDKIINLESEKCPLKESALIYQDFRIAMRNGTMLKNSLSNHNLIKIKIDKFLNSDRSMKEMGVCLGYITKMIVYGTSYSNYNKDINEKRVTDILEFLA